MEKRVAICGIMFNDTRDKIVMVKEKIKAKHTNIENADTSFWVLPGGGKKPNKSFVQTIVEEFWEETNLILTHQPKPLFVSEKTEPETLFQRQIVLCHYEPGELSHKNDPEGQIEAVQWMPVTKVIAEMEKYPDDAYKIPVLWYLHNQRRSKPKKLEKKWIYHVVNGDCKQIYPIKLVA